MNGCPLNGGFDYNRTLEGKNRGDLKKMKAFRKNKKSKKTPWLFLSGNNDGYRLHFGNGNGEDYFRGKLDPVSMS